MLMISSAPPVTGVLYSRSHRAEVRREIGRKGMKGEAAISSSTGFSPVARQDASILILGSLPSERSLQAGQYYAHPQNSFWRLMRDLTGAEGAYVQRCAALVDHGIALWDVLLRSVRPGSMDADIDLETAKSNDFDGFLVAHQHISLICFNGRKAAQLFQRLVVLDKVRLPMRLVTLPSTSPAYASMTYDDKLTEWREALDRQQHETGDVL